MSGIGVYGDMVLRKVKLEGFRLVRKRGKPAIEAFDIVYFFKGVFDDLFGAFIRRVIPQALDDLGRGRERKAET